MKLYKVVRYCRHCKKKFFAENQKYAYVYCEECFNKYIKKSPGKEEKKEKSSTKKKK